MRNLHRWWALLAVLVVCLIAGPHDLKAGGCTLTNCGMYCVTQGPFAGYCNAPAADESGCVQLDGPGCASMGSAACCRTGGEGSF